MGKLRDRLHDQAGETLVELMVSIVIFLLLLGTLAGAISFATNAQQKAQSLRDNAAALQDSVRHTDPTDTGQSRTVTFHATDADGTVVGNQVCQVPVQLQTIHAQGTSGATDFAVFGTAKTPAEGGGGSGG